MGIYGIANCNDERSNRSIVSQQSQHRIASIAASYRSIISQHRIAASYRSNRSVALQKSQHRIASQQSQAASNRSNRSVALQYRIAASYRSIVSHRSNHRQHRIAAIAAWHCSIVSQHRIAAIAASFRSKLVREVRGKRGGRCRQRLQGMDGIGLRTTAPPEFEGHYSVSYGYNPLPIYHSQRFPAGRRQQSIISNTLKSQARSDPSRVAGDSVLQQGHSLNP
mgnify:CR=1 FL=1